MSSTKQVIIGCSKNYILPGQVISQYNQRDFYFFGLLYFLTFAVFFPFVKFTFLIIAGCFYDFKFFLADKVL